MPYTNSAAVEAICPKKQSSDSFTPFIEAANVIVVAVCVPNGYTDPQLELIERWLSAHCYSIMRNQQRFRSAGKVQEALDSKVDLGLDQTRYGQMAKNMAFKGDLAAWDNTLKSVKTELPGADYTIGMQWLGTDEEDT